MSNELFSLAINNFNRLVELCPFLLEDVIPSSHFSVGTCNYLLDFKIEIINSNHDFTELILSYSQDNTVLDPVMKVFIIRTHGVVFPISYNDGDVFLEYSNSDFRSRLSLSYFLSFWLDDLLTQNYTIPQF